LPLLVSRVPRQAGESVHELIHAEHGVPNRRRIGGTNAFFCGGATRREAPREPRANSRSGKRRKGACRSERQGILRQMGTVHFIGRWPRSGDLRGPSPPYDGRKPDSRCQLRFGSFANLSCAQWKTLDCGLRRIRQPLGAARGSPPLPLLRQQQSNYAVRRRRLAIKPTPPSNKQTDEGSGTAVSGVA
jgi:hypothetical protein